VGRCAKKRLRTLEDRRQSVPGGLKPGLRVKATAVSAWNGVSVERLDDDTKLVVRFLSVARRRCGPKFAKLK